MVTKGYLALVLHAHLPFIRHPEHESFLEENWLFEGITDSYIPLVNVFDNLISDNIDFRITVSLSPTLLAMLRDEFLVSRYLRHLDKLITLAELEAKRTRNDGRLNDVALMYLSRFRNAKHVFSEKYNNDLTGAFRKFRDLGKVEIITSCATHGYLPLLNIHEQVVRAQIATAVDAYEEVFKARPAGIWLPECGYCPGQDKALGEFGIRYFFVETHGIMCGRPEPRYGVYSPYTCGSGVHVLGRDVESSRSVWSSREGYPGDRNYREYHRDIGFDLDYDYIRPFLNGCGSRINVGIKYYRVTGKTDHKDIYDRKAALDTAAVHAEDFLSGREKQVERLTGIMDRAPIIVAPYDAELFGHWWFEGPEWLELLLRKMHRRQDSVGTITPAEYLNLYEDYPALTPSESSWGYRGYSEIWLNGANDWIYRHLHKMAELMTDAAREYSDATGLKKRALNQMARELLLAQSSDWAFMMKTGRFVDYATGRTKEHVRRFLELNDQLKKDDIDTELLTEAEERYGVFENIDYGIFAG